MTKSILIIEDEEDLAFTLVHNLQREGFKVEHVISAEDGFKLIEAKKIPHLMLLDVMLPGMTGMEACRRLRSSIETKDIPVIMLTARGESIDRLIGFESGADDYVIKPFNMRELIMRIHAILRRSSSHALTPQNNIEQFGIIRLDRQAHRVFIAEDEIQLSSIEFKLLTYFLDKKGWVRSRDALLDEVWGMNTYVQTRTVDSHVKNLREKLGVAGDYIETIRGVGYRFRATP